MKRNIYMRILFVVKPSTDGGHIETSAIIKSRSKELGYNFEIFETTGKDVDRIQIMILLDKYKPDVSVAVGGDGTVNLLATQLIKAKNKDIKFGVIPMGSANGFAYNMGVPLNAEKALSMIMDGRTKNIDVLKVNDKYSIHLCDLGINARVVKRFEKEGAHGFWGYGKQVFAELWTNNPTIHYELTANGSKTASKAEMIVATNMCCYGTGANINPTGNMQDGMFETIILKPYPWWMIFSLIVSSFVGKLHKMKNIKIMASSKVQFKFSRPIDLNIDGEIDDNVKYLHLEVLPAALKVITKSS